MRREGAAGHFTQEDPIGLAGGMNLYGYGAGDPVNNSDPFGLCPKSGGGDGKTDDTSDCPRGTSGWWAHRDAQGEGSSLVNNVMGIWAIFNADMAAQLPEGTQIGIVPSWIGGHRFAGGMNNYRSLNGARIGRFRVSVDAEIGGSGLGQIHVQIQGMEKILINSVDDLAKLPGVVQGNAKVLKAIEKGVVWLTKQRTP